MEMGNAQVGGGPHAKSGDSGKETGEAQVGGGPREGAGVVAGGCA